MGLKTLLKRRLPTPIVNSIKRVRYANKMRQVSVESELDFKVIACFVKRGDSVIDLGANMGFYTKYLSDLVGSDGVVHSIEPIQETFNTLRYIVRKLGLNNVQLLNCAVSNGDSTVTMEVPLFDNGEENYYEARIIRQDATPALQTVKVHSHKLDSLILLTNKISFIKCDVEGHEYECIQGARSIIESSRPAWLVEVWGDLDKLPSRAHLTVKYLEDFGYGVYWFDGVSLRKRRLGNKSINYFFLMPDHIAHLKERSTIPLDIA